MNTEALTRLSKAKPPRPGATEERIYADKQKARKTAELVAALAKKAGAR